MRLAETSTVAARAAGLSAAVGLATAVALPAVARATEPVGTLAATSGTRATTSTPRTSAKVTVKVNAPKHVIPSKKVIFRGSISPKAGGVEVRRMLKVKGLWELRATTRTSKSGKFKFKVGTFDAETSYTYQIWVPARKGFKSAKSRDFTVFASNKVPKSSAITSTISAHAPSTTVPISLITIYGAVSPIRAGVVVQRQRLVSGKWAVWAQTTTDNDGTYSFTVGPFVTATTYVYRLVAVGDQQHLTAFSNPLVVAAS